MELDKKLNLGMKGYACLIGTFTLAFTILTFQRGQPAVHVAPVSGANPRAKKAHGHVQQKKTAKQKKPGINTAAPLQEIVNVDYVGQHNPFREVDWAGRDNPLLK